MHDLEHYSAQGLRHTSGYQQGEIAAFSLLHVLALSLSNPWLVHKKQRFPFFQLQCQCCAILSSGIGSQGALPEDGPAKKRPAPARVTGQSEGSRPTKTSSDLYCFAHGIASFQFIFCSLAPTSWLHKSMKGCPLMAVFQRGVNSHSVTAYLLYTAWPGGDNGWGHAASPCRDADVCVTERLIPQRTQVVSSSAAPLQGKVQVLSVPISTAPRGHSKG